MRDGGKQFEISYLIKVPSPHKSDETGIIPGEGSDVELVQMEVPVQQYIGPLVNEQSTVLLVITCCQKALGEPVATLPISNS